MQDSVKVDRNKYIGGSDIATILGLNPYKTRFQLLQEKAGIIEDTFEGNEYTEYGNVMEAKIRNYINSIEYDGFVEGKHYYTIPNHDIDIRCHTDGENSLEILEIKTTSTVYSDVNKHLNYLVQLLFYMMVAEKALGVLAIYERPSDFNTEFDENRLHFWHIGISDYKTWCEKIHTAVYKFAEDLDKLKENPFLTEEDLLQGTLIEMATNRVIAFEQRLAEMKQLEAELKEAKAKLKKAMEDAGVKKFKTDAGYSITLVEDSTTIARKFDVDKFYEENEELYEKYMHDEIKNRAGYVKITVPKEKK